MTMEPVLQENGANSMPLHMTENRSVSTASFGGSTVNGFPGLEAVSSQNATIVDSNNTSASIWSSPNETFDGSFQPVPPLQEPVVTTSQQGALEAFSSQSSTVDSSECSKSSARSSVLNQSERTSTTVPPIKKPIITTFPVGHKETIPSQSSNVDRSKETTSPARPSILDQPERTFTPVPPITTSHVDRTEAVSSTNSTLCSSESTTPPTWSSVVKQSVKPSTLAVSASAKRTNTTSASLESSGRSSTPVVLSTTFANVPSHVAQNSVPCQSSPADRPTNTSSSTRSTSFEQYKRPSTPLPPSGKPATMTSPATTPSKTGSVPSSSSDNDFRKIPKGVYVVCDHFLEGTQKRPAKICEIKPCKGCENRSKLKYAVWSDNRKRWQLIRPYPEKVRVNVAFKECKHYASNLPCLKKPCLFAHGQQELTMWTMEREGGKFNKGEGEKCKLWSCELRNDQGRKRSYNRKLLLQSDSSLIINIGIPSPKKSFWMLLNGKVLPSALRSCMIH